jgi:DNA-binding beta-propeller fold protein YncE
MRFATACSSGFLALACAASPLPAENPVEQPKERAPLVPVLVDPPANQAATRVARVSNMGFKAPASAVHDTKTDSYLLSNVNGSPFAADNDGFISKLNPDGRLIALQFIAGGQNQVVLNAPKGMVVVGRSLYVADLNTVRVFDVDTGAAKDAIVIEGAQCLMDVAAAPDGSLYVSDVGLKEGFQPSGSDAIYRIDAEKRVERIAAGASLGQPTGLSADADGVWVATLGSGEIFHLGKDKKLGSVQRPPSGKLVGLTTLDDQVILVGSWDCGCVYKSSQGTFTKVIDAVPGAGDIAYDNQRKRLLIPLANSDVFETHSLP